MVPCYYSSNYNTLVPARYEPLLFIKSFKKLFTLSQVYLQTASVVLPYWQLAPMALWPPLTRTSGRPFCLTKINTNTDIENHKHASKLRVRFEPWCLQVVEHSVQVRICNARHCDQLTRCTRTQCLSGCLLGSWVSGRSAFQPVVREVIWEL